MPPELGALLINQVVSLRKKVSDQSPLRQRQRFGELLTGFCKQCASQNNSIAGLGVTKMLHQAQVVKVSFDPTSDVAGLAYVQGFELIPPAATKDVDTCPVRNPAEVEAIYHIVFNGVLELNCPTPLNV